MSRRSTKITDAAAMAELAAVLENERLEGLDAIRKAIDPKMSETTFYRRWRWYIAPILIEYERWWERNPQYRYFTWRRLLYKMILERGKV